jgi:hypothetical protein
MTDARGRSFKSGEHFETISLGQKNAKIFKIILLFKKKFFLKREGNSPYPFSLLFFFPIKEK